MKFLNSIGVSHVIIKTNAIVSVLYSNFLIGETLNHLSSILYALYEQIALYRK